MKQTVIGILLILFGFPINSFSSQADKKVSVAVSSASETLNWPNYEKDFVLSPDGEKPYVDMVSNTLKRKYISELPPVILGKTWLYLNNLENPSEGVGVCSLLGNDKVMRIWLVATPTGVVIKQAQLKINGKWVGGQLGTKPVISLLDPEKLLKNDVITGVLVTLDSVDNGAPLQLLILNIKDQNWCCRRAIPELLLVITV